MGIDKVLLQGNESAADGSLRVAGVLPRGGRALAARADVQGAAVLGRRGRPLPPRQALPHQDATFTRLELSFHAAHLLEARGLRKAARDAYAKLLNEPQLALTLKADVCRQLGKSVFFIVTLFCALAFQLYQNLAKRTIHAYRRFRMHVSK